MPRTRSNRRKSLCASTGKGIGFNLHRCRQPTVRRNVLVEEKPLKGRVAIITGANQGLGLEIARRYITAGADLMICSRNSNLLDIAKTELQALATPEQRVSSLSADVSKQADVEELVKATLSEFGSCQILVNNAGVYGPKGEIET